MTQCRGINRDGSSCQMRAVQDNLCFSHFQISRQVDFYQVPTAEIFTWPAGDVAYRISKLTRKQIQALELVVDGQTYDRAAAILGVTQGSVSNRISAARKLAGMRTVQQLVAVYACWRAGKVGANMP